MRIAVRHGINGNEELATTGGYWCGSRMGSHATDSLEACLRFPVSDLFLYLNSTAEILSPVRTISSQMAPLDSEVCYLVQKLQYPTAEHYQTLMTALYEKDVIELLYLLGQGIDLTWKVPDGGHTSSLLWQSSETTTVTHISSKPPRTCISPGPGVSLTYLLLQSLANPNILPPKQQPDYYVGTGS